MPADPAAARKSSLLQNIRVLDLSRVLAGPWCAQILADLGADVIKVERPRLGDDARSYPPFFRSPGEDNLSQSSYYLCVNRGKRSIEIDFSTEAGQMKVRELAKTSDVLVENHKVGTLKRYGLDYESLAAINPRLIYCSVTGFGQTGPYARNVAYDTTIQAMGGLMSVTGVPDGQPGGGPLKVGVPLVDVLTGTYAATAILAALNERAVSGLGQQVDLALLDVCVAGLSIIGSAYLVSGEVPRQMGNALKNSAPSNIYYCKDGGRLMMNLGNDRQFAAFCRSTGLDHLAADPRYGSNPARVANRAPLDVEVAARFREENLDYWLRMLSEAGIPCAPINSFDQLVADPQLQARQMFIRLPHERVGETPAIANPMRFSRTPIKYHSAAPLLGEHNDEIDREIGRPGACNSGKSSA
jgi:crotonobetainyl-CoA:carnitine CoA-transferase CaiB-like acyl-CoA transferase